MSARTLGGKEVMLNSVSFQYKGVELSRRWGLSLILALLLVACFGQARAGDSYILSRQSYARSATPSLTVRLQYPSLQSDIRFGFSQAANFTGAPWNTYVPGNELSAIDVRFGVISILEPAKVETKFTLEPWRVNELRITPGNQNGALYELKDADGQWQTLYDSRNQGTGATDANLRIFASDLYKKSSVDFINCSVTDPGGQALFTSDFKTTEALQKDWNIGSSTPEPADITQDQQLTLVSENDCNTVILARHVDRRSSKPVLELKFKYLRGEGAGFLGFINSTCDGPINTDPLAKPYASCLHFLGNAVKVREGQKISDGNFHNLAEGWNQLRISLGADSGALYECRPAAGDKPWETIADTRGKGDATANVRFFLARYGNGATQIDDLAISPAGNFQDDFSGPDFDLAKWMPVGYVHRDTSSVVASAAGVRIHGTSMPADRYFGMGAALQDHMQPVFDDMTARLKKIGYPQSARFEQDDNEIRTLRDVSTIHFSKKNGVIDNIELRGFKLDQKTLMANLIFSVGDKTYEQQYANDCNLSIREEAPNYILEGEFTPKTSSGEAYQFKVRLYHRLDQMNGALYTKYSFNVAQNQYIPVQAKMLRIENTMGVTPREMNAMQLGYLGKDQNDMVVLASRDSALVSREKNEFSSYSWGYGVIQNYIDLNTVPKDQRYFIASRPMHQATWTDGYMGFQLMPITWRYTAIDDAVESTTTPLPYRYVTPYVEPDNRRGIAITFVNMGSDGTLNSGAIYEQAIALLPAVKPHIVPGFVNSNNQMPNINYPSRDLGYYVEWEKSTADELKQAALEGTRYMLTVYANDSHGFNWDGKVQMYNTLCRYYGMVPIEYTGDMTVTANHTLDGRPLTEEEKKGLYIDTRISKGKHAPEHLMEGFHCKQSELARDVFMLHVFNIFANNTSRGVFFDMTGYFNCSNTRHGCDIKGSYPFSGDIQCMDDMRRLADSYPEKRYMLAHNWDSIPFPKIGLYDFTLPGEQIGGQRRRKLSYVEENTGYSTLLNGAACILYEGAPAYTFWDESSNKEHTTIIEQALRKCNPAFWCTARNFSNRPERERNVLRKYFLPLVVFDTAKAELHHPMDYDYHRYASAPADVDMLIYNRPDKKESLVVAVNVPHNQPSAELKLNLKALGIEGTNLLLLDPRGKPALTKATATGETFTLTRNLAEGPQILLLRADTTPTELWHDPFLFNVDSKYDASSKTLSLALTGVPTSSGQLWVYTADANAPTNIKGATLTSFDASQHLANLKVDQLSFHGDGTVTMNF